MTRPLASLFLVSMLCLSTCGCVRFAAETILTVSYPADTGRPAQEMGIWECYHDDGLFWGCGWHPREHETYFLPFIISEPQYAETPRELRMKRLEAGKAGPDVFEITLFLDPQFTPYGHAPSDQTHWARSRDVAVQQFRSEHRLEIRDLLGRRYCDLNQLALERIGRPAEVVYLSARIVAKPMPEDQRQRLKASGALGDDE